jgi:hypothetical protein
MVTEYFNTIKKSLPKTLPSPDLLIHFNEANPELREEYGFSHPFPVTSDKKWRGCYLFWSELIKLNWDNEKPFDVDMLEIKALKDHIVPLYAGRSTALPTRIWQHCTWRTKWMCEYWDKDWLFRIKDEVWQLCIPHVFIWLVQNKDEMLSLEHLIIGITKPFFNKQ